MYVCLSAQVNCYPDKAVQREVLAIEVVCRYEQLGCTWQDKLKLWEVLIHVHICAGTSEEESG